MTMCDSVLAGRSFVLDFLPLLRSFSNSNISMYLYSLSIHVISVSRKGVVSLVLSLAILSLICSHRKQDRKKNNHKEETVRVFIHIAKG